MKATDKRIAAWPQRRENDLVFTSRVLLNCSLPLRPLKRVVLSKQGKKEVIFASKFIRDSGPYRLKILADESFGIPFGKDRLLIFWLITQAISKKSRIIYYKSVRSILDQLRLDYGKANREWLRAAISRVLNSTLFFEYDNGLVHGVEKDTILSKVVGVLDPKKAEYESCYFEISQDFFRELVTERHGLPFDLEMISSFGKNYGAMDLYIWWNHKIYKSQSTQPYTYIPLDKLKPQFSALDVTTKEFKRQMVGWAKEVNRVVQKVYEIDAKITVSKDSLVFKSLELPFKPFEEIEHPNTHSTGRSSSSTDPGESGLEPITGVFADLCNRARQRSREQ